VNFLREKAPDVTVVELERRLDSSNVFTAPNMFDLAPGFVAGANTLDFVVGNGYGSTGLDVSITPISPTAGIGGSAPGCSCAAHPINLGSGDVFEQVPDYTTTGQNRLIFARYYDSKRQPATFAALGANWRSTYDRYLRILSASVVTAERASGQQLTFTLSRGEWTPNTDVDFSLRMRVPLGR
jgi:hypothetical protein